MTHQTTSQGDAPARRPWIKPVLLLAAVITVMVLAAVLDLGRYLKELQDWIKGFGLWGPVVFVALYAAATVLALPGSALTALAGGIFGSLVGIATVSAGSTLGAALAFLVARYLARDSVEKWLAGNENSNAWTAWPSAKGPWWWPSPAWFPCSPSTCSTTASASPGCPLGPTFFSPGCACCR